MKFTVVPITLRQAKAFIAEHHRHSTPPTGYKFGIGLRDGVRLVGVVTVGRPVAPALQDETTCEANRNCTDGSRNACSMLYGAAWRAAKAMGYRRLITYTQADETGASLRAAGFVRVANLPPRGSWADHNKKRPGRKTSGGGVARVRWEICSRQGDQE